MEEEGDEEEMECEQEGSTNTRDLSKRDSASRVGSTCSFGAPN